MTDDAPGSPVRVAGLLMDPARKETGLAPSLGPAGDVALAHAGRIRGIFADGRAREGEPTARGNALCLDAPGNTGH